MIHNNVPLKRKPKAKLRATGEIIRKNGKKEPVEILGDTDMTEEELIEQLRGEKKQEQATNIEVN